MSEETNNFRRTLKTNNSSEIIIKSKEDFYNGYKLLSKSEIPSEDYDIALQNNFIPIKEIDSDSICILTNRAKLKISLSKEKDKTPLRILQKYISPNTKIILTETPNIFFEIVGAQSVIDKEYSDDDARKFFIDLLTDASRKNASDIHIVWEKNNVTAKYRIDGYLKKQPSKISKPLANAVKNILINRAGESEYEENEVAGIISEIIDGVHKEYRLSIGPTVNGNVIVIRLESHISNDATLEKWGYTKRAAQIVRKLFDSHYGLVLVTGETGSGKSTLLYTSIIEAKNKDSEYSPEILTVEDPVEVQIDGVNQVQVNTKGKPENWMTFSRAIKMFLRQDPDMIVVGEIRDSDVAIQAITAAKTGHLTASTLHTNDVKSTFSRLRELGIQNSNIEDGVRGVISQKLLNKLCNNCKIPFDRHGQTYYRRNENGCPVCASSSLAGCKGRVPIIEVAMLNSNPENYKPENFEDYYSLDENIIELVENGIIDEEEAARWINIEENSDLGKRKEMLEIWNLATKEKDSTKYLFSLFQPILDSRNYIIGYESLLRMRTLSGDIVKPQYFLELSKKMGMYSSISMLVLDQLISVAKKSEKKIFWNIDRDNIEDENFLESFLYKVQKTNTTSKFVLEFKFDQSYLNFITKCNQSKIQISLDNFKGDMSDIVFIERNNLIIDYIKTNEDFIFGVQKTEKWMDDYLTMCRHLNTEIIVNYIETDPMLTSVRKNYGEKIVGYQGFGIRRPDFNIDEYNALEQNNDN